MNEIRELDRKLDLLMIHFPEFLEQLRIMCLILICTGINKVKVFLLKMQISTTGMKIIG
ncbi:hypothetical protein K160097B7_02160 [[Clostridium] hylemonae]